MKRLHRGMISLEMGYGIAERMHRRDPATASYNTTLTAMLDAAVDFGLTRDEARGTFHQALADPRREATVAGYLDRIAGALAREILIKQRRALGSSGI
jgi:hypothetical protein